MSGRLPLAVCLLSIALPPGLAVAQTQTQQNPAVTVGTLVAEGYVVRGVSMPDHHAVNFIAQKDKTIYWCEGTNFGAVLLGKERAIETRCYEVK
ncbi:MAG: hypothetical protein F9K44_06700 [Hyphomicrobiaceae bacterium]|nr:MAG: hypothetical protein F9K44_06700 [Hyphomicrobiaceae bacterium]